MDAEEINREILECARYGEHEELQEYLRNGGNVNYKDDSGNTALHKAAANGHVECLSVLKAFGAEYVANAQGNLPLHWAVQNRNMGAIKYLINNFDVDMLAQNSFGKSILTEAFQTQDTDIIEICLSHQSSTEEKLIQTNGGSQGGEVVIEGEDGSESRPAQEQHAVFHEFDFEGDPTLKRRILRIRELPITRADNPFGSESAPEDDTTGLGIWPASILAARWALQNWELLDGKVVAELGAGCGVPGLAVATRTRARKVYLTDIHQPTLENADANVQLNSSPAAMTGEQEAVSTTVFSKSLEASSATFASRTISKSSANGEASAPCDVSVLMVNWADKSSYPTETIDVLIGSDLVYDSNILSLLVPAIKDMLSIGGSFLYVAPNEGRDGMDQLVNRLITQDSDESYSIILVSQKDCPEEFFSNPLSGGEDSSDLYVLHFYDLSIRKPHSLFHFQKVPRIVS